MFSNRHHRLRPPVAVLAAVIVSLFAVAMASPVGATDMIGARRSLDVLTGLAAPGSSGVVGPTNCRAATGRVAVAVVVVHGDGAEPVVGCADLASNANGFDALRSAGFTPRVDKGFVCGIDGVPATGCATGAGFDGNYWRYFRGGADGRWTYASTGAGSRLVRHDGCAYEGWVWSGQQEITPPRLTPAAIDCVHVPPATTPPATTTTTRPPSIQPPATTPTDRGNQRGNGTAAPGPGATDARGRPPVTVPVEVAGIDDTPSGSASGGPGQDRGDDDDSDRIQVDGAGRDVDQDQRVDSGDGPDPTDVSGAGGRSAETDVDRIADGRAGTGETAAVEGIIGERSSTGSPLSTLLTLVFVGLVGVGVWAVGRRRSAHSSLNP